MIKYSGECSVCKPRAEGFFGIDSAISNPQKKCLEHLKSSRLSFSNEKSWNEISQLSRLILTLLINSFRSIKSKELQENGKKCLVNCSFDEGGENEDSECQENQENDDEGNNNVYEEDQENDDYEEEEDEDGEGETEDDDDSDYDGNDDDDNDDDDDDDDGNEEEQQKEEEDDDDDEEQEGERINMHFDRPRP